MKKNEDRKAQALVSDLKISETILLSQKKKKFITTLDQLPFHVTRMKETIITAIRNRNMLLKTFLSSRKCSDIVEPELQDDDGSMHGKMMMNISILLKEIHN